MPTTPSTPPMTDLTSAMSADELRQAALTVCAYATDAAEARDLLEALGLLDVLRETSLAS